MPKDKSDLQEVWTVDVYSNDVDVDTGTIMIVSSREEALRRVKALNETEGYGVPFENGYVDFNSEEYDRAMYNNNDFQYYDVGSFYIDEPFYLD